MATIKEKTINKFLTPFAIFLVFALENQERNRKTKTKIIIPITKIFIINIYLYEITTIKKTKKCQKIS